MKWWIISALVVACVIGGLELHFAYKARAAEPADLTPAARAWFGFERCLLGKPLRHGEYFRERESLVRVVDDESWPARCAEHMQRLGRELDSAKIDRPPSFDQALEDLAKGKTTMLENVISSLTWRFQSEPRVDLPDVRAPQIQPLLDPLELATLPVEYYESDPPRGRSLRIAPNVGAGHACVFDDLTRGRCGYAPDDAGKLDYPDLIAGDERTLPAFATQSGIVDVFSGRTLLADVNTRDAYVALDGRVTALVDEKTILRSSESGKPEKLALPARAVAPALLSSKWLLALMPGARNKAYELVVLPLGSETLAFGEPIVLAEVPASYVAASSRVACGFGDAFYVWFRANGKILIGERDSWKLVDGALESEGGSLSCDAKGASMLLIEGELLRHTRCTKAGCRERKTTLPKHPAAEKTVATVLGERVVVIRYKQGLAFLSSGKVDELAKARPQLLFSLRLIHDIDLFPRGDAALGILQAMDLRRLVFGIDRDGKPRTVPLRDLP